MSSAGDFNGDGYPGAGSTGPTTNQAGAAPDGRTSFSAGLGRGLGLNAGGWGSPGISSDMP